MWEKGCGGKNDKTFTHFGDPAVRLNGSPVASFVSSSPDVLGQTTTFQSTSTGNNLSYQWDLGDGSPPVNGPAPIITHTYAATGTYSVVLTATNSISSSTATGLVEILEAIPLYLPLIFKNNVP